jgi:hypothetical protein
MSKPEDKTLNTIRMLSDKKASKNQGSIVTAGGIYIGKNIECAEQIVTEDLVVKGLTKLAGDLSIGGTIYCPDLYNVDDDICRFKRNLVPAKPKIPISTCDKSTLGTHKEPWDILFAKCTKTTNIETSTITAGINKFGNPSFQILPNEINISDNLNIINPETNVVMLKSCDGVLEAYTPIYQQWDSVHVIELGYNPKEILYINASTIILNIGNMNELFLCYDADLVPNSTKVKIYFVKQNQLSKAYYKLILTRFNKKYVFTSIIPTKKIKMLFMENCVYLLS